MHILWVVNELTGADPYQPWPNSNTLNRKSCDRELRGRDFSGNDQFLIEILERRKAATRTPGHGSTELGHLSTLIPFSYVLLSLSFSPDLTELSA